MSRLLSCLFMVASISSVCLPTTSNADNSISETGNELINNCNDTNYQASNILWAGCIAYVTGVYDGLIYGAMHIMVLEHNEITAKQLVTLFQIGFGFCMPASVTRGQEALVVSKYLHNHPEILNEASYTLILDAFQAAWPCPKSTK